MAFQVEEVHIMAIAWTAFFVVLGLCFLWGVNRFLKKNGLGPFNSSPYYAIVGAGILFLALFLPFTGHSHREPVADTMKEPAKVQITPPAEAISAGKELQKDFREEKKRESSTVNEDLRKRSEDMFDKLWEKEKEQRKTDAVK